MGRADLLHEGGVLVLPVLSLWVKFIDTVRLLLSSALAIVCSDYSLSRVAKHITKSFSKLRIWLTQNQERSNGNYPLIATRKLRTTNGRQRTPYRRARDRC